MAAAVRIRTFEMRDYEQVVALWRAAGLSLSLSDDEPGIEHRLQRDAELFIVAESGGRAVGAVMGCYDGRRGWVNHLAVAPGQQRNGIGTMLMAELEARFRALGCVKVNLLISPGNGGVQPFYDAIGYTRDDLIFMEKVLRPAD
ncbi:MAG: GNAT family acetyltransferase [Chloroflexi bacterium]|nr:GNAT family acetyltransferase [Chloroflexota bacterium]